MDLCKPTAQGMELSTRLAALLELALQSAENMIEGESTLPWNADVAAHAAHPNQALRLQRWSPLRARCAV